MAAVIHHAITTDEPQLRYAVSWGGRELVEGRAAIADADWVALGAIADDAEYYRRFARPLRPRHPPAADSELRVSGIEPRHVLG